MYSLIDYTPRHYYVSVYSAHILCKYSFDKLARRKQN